MVRHASAHPLRQAPWTGTVLSGSGLPSGSSRWDPRRLCPRCPAFDERSTRSPHPRPPDKDRTQPSPLPPPTPEDIARSPVSRLHGAQSHRRQSHIQSHSSRTPRRVCAILLRGRTRPLRAAAGLTIATNDFIERTNECTNERRQTNGGYFLPLHLRLSPPVFLYSLRPSASISSVQLPLRSSSASTSPLPVPHLRHPPTTPPASHAAPPRTTHDPDK
ncbi:hypothetical protein L226DRAFT_34650 [Lentinus tigrinus ALCF2SS1-7]|uniref:uncharacterized protein n=1 Tax=Lentinus tigrinus ALCF2SS1-7 TaxID=1328758 RepID=UPI001165F945|nr:hypothetical protein L226DRAFT_34650 [Lentinus tigrinus ALCF2SS1-7]